MDLLGALEHLAAIAPDGPSDPDDEIDPEAVCRWQRLYGYTSSEAKTQISRQRQDPDALVPLALWDIVKGKEEGQGHDRASYSHSIHTIKNKPRQAVGNLSQDASSTECLVKLEGPLDSREKVQSVLDLPQLPPTYTGQSGENGDTAQFCKIDANAKQTLRAWLEKQSSGFHLTTISWSMARKDFCFVSSALRSVLKALHDSTVPMEWSSLDRSGMSFLSTISSMEHSSTRLLCSVCSGIWMDPILSTNYILPVSRAAYFVRGARGSTKHSLTAHRPRSFVELRSLWRQRNMRTPYAPVRQGYTRWFGVGSYWIAKRVALSTDAHLDTSGRWTSRVDATSSAYSCYRQSPGRILHHKR